jgi:hypothetical protein
VSLQLWYAFVCGAQLQNTEGNPQKPLLASFHYSPVDSILDILPSRQNGFVELGCTWLAGRQVLGVPRAVEIFRKPVDPFSEECFKVHKMK